jgi:hypothetical protein
MRENQLLAASGRFGIRAAKVIDPVESILIVRSGTGLDFQSDALVLPRQRKQAATFIGSSVPPLTDVMVKFTSSPRGCQMVPRDDDGRLLSATRRT